MIKSGMSKCCDFGFVIGNPKISWTYLKLRLRNREFGKKLLCEIMKM